MSAASSSSLSPMPSALPRTSAPALPPQSLPPSCPSGRLDWMKASASLRIPLRSGGGASSSTPCGSENCAPSISCGVPGDPRTGPMTSAAGSPILRLARRSMGGAGRAAAVAAAPCAAAARRAGNVSLPSAAATAEGTYALPPPSSPSLPPSSSSSGNRLLNCRFPGPSRMKPEEARDSCCTAMPSSSRSSASRSSTTGSAPLRSNSPSNCGSYAASYSRRMCSSGVLSTLVKSDSRWARCPLCSAPPARCDGRNALLDRLPASARWKVRTGGPRAL
mmetsp:Transcript_38914/g.99517  ORF Transcript_38914/g.99517 Transcript_38914/m.99517 type:complete len:277 (+) Transcript_38914:326-1156(+)